MKKIWFASWLFTNLPFLPAGFQIIQSRIFGFMWNACIVPAVKRSCPVKIAYTLAVHHGGELDISHSVNRHGQELQQLPETDYKSNRWNIGRTYESISILSSKKCFSKHLLCVQFWLLAWRGLVVSRRWWRASSSVVIPWSCAPRRSGIRRSTP